ncbi:hypothetical protein GJAV_G00133680 [Gymnothorax javanicus]|nr:hypothetical protein GJAV_G00133680 [Gymnothorax javanicus]
MHHALCSTHPKEKEGGEREDFATPYCVSSVLLFNEAQRSKGRAFRLRAGSYSTQVDVFTLSLKRACGHVPHSREMVMFSTRQRTPLDPGFSSDLLMNSETPDFGVSARDPAGYLGKVNERASLVENCPWCRNRGLTYGLRSYRINFHESITLCTNPECLFPLVSKPLDEILNSLALIDCKDDGKRKGPGEENLAAGSKRHKADDFYTALNLSSYSDGGMSLQSLGRNCEHAEYVTRLHGECSNHHVQLVLGDQSTGPRGEDLRPSSPQVQGEAHWEDDGDEADFSEQQRNDSLKNLGGLVCESVGEMVLVSDGDSTSVEGERPSLERVVPLPEEQVLFGSSEEPEVSPALEPEKRPVEEQAMRPSASLPAEQQAWITEGEDDLTEETKVRLKQELNAGPLVQVEARLETEVSVRPIVAVDMRPGAVTKPIPEEMAAVLTDGLNIGPVVQQESGPLEMVAPPSQLFWRNENHLCWLDALLVALVQCRTLRKPVACLPKNKSPIQQLCNRYRKACDLLTSEEQMCSQGKTVKVPSAVLDQALKEMEDLRMSTFKLLQPKLKCTLGEEETPVFALPILLRLDSEAETLFQHTFHWDFECFDCGHTSRSRCQKTLSTFTGVLPDWHPLHAVHEAQCNQCQRQHQKRKMVLKSISPVFALHFVEGLPQNDVDVYTFDFHGNFYSVSTIIQYDHHLKHFATWIRDLSGSWLEFDDLKYPQCTSHKTLPVPANQIHLVFWEIQSAKPEGVQPGGRHGSNAAVVKLTSDNESCKPDLLPAAQQDHSYFVEALTEDSRVSPNGRDSSVGSVTLPDAFNGLSHDDVVTLTLVEVKSDGDEQIPADSGEQSLNTVETCSISSRRGQGGKVNGTPKQQRGKKNMMGGKVDTGEVDVPLVTPPPAPYSSPPASKSPSPAPDSSSPMRLPPAPPAFPASRWSSAVLSRHPAFQSTPAPQKSAATTLSCKPTLKLSTDDNLSDRAAEMFRGFQAREVTAVPSRSPNVTHSQSEDPRMQTRAFNFKQPWPPNPKPAADNPTPPFLQPPHKSEQPLSRSSLVRPTKNPKIQTAALDDTNALRRKLLKRLKRKKKLLAALDSMMGKQEETLKWLQRPDSAELGSPYTVSSTTSQCSSTSGYDEILNDLLSPVATTTTTASNLSPDSTGLLEMLATGQEGGEILGKNLAATQLGGGATNWPAPASAGNELASAKEDFLEELMSGSVIQPSHSDNVDLNMFDMFF